MKTAADPAAASGRSGPSSPGPASGFGLSLAVLVLLILTGTALKLFYSGAPDDEPRWLLAATVRVFSTISGIAFRFESGQGYLSADGRLLVYRGCSGLNFLVLTCFLAGLLPVALRLERLAARRFVQRGDQPVVDGRFGAAPPSLSGLFFYYSVALIGALAFTLLANAGRMLALLTLAAFVGPAVLRPGAAHLSVGSFVYLVFLVLFYLTLRLTMRIAESEKRPSI